MKITKIFKRIKCEIMYRQATAKADYAAKKNKGEIYFVLPTEKGNLMIMNRPLFEAFKKTKLVDKDRSRETSSVIVSIIPTARAREESAAASASSSDGRA